MAHEELIATLRWNGENKVWFPADRCSEVADALAAAEASRTAWRETLEAQEDRCAAAEAERDRIQGENERLRILVDEYRTEYVDLDFEKRAAEAERDRYRAALETLGTELAQYSGSAVARMAQLVREALAEPGSNPKEAELMAHEELIAEARRKADDWNVSDDDGQLFALLADALAAAEADRDRYRAATEVPCNDDSERYCDGWRDAMNLVRRRGAALAEPGSEPAMSEVR